MKWRHFVKFTTQGEELKSKLTKLPGTRTFLAKFTKEGTSVAKPNNTRNGVRVEFTSPLLAILLVICITIRGTQAFANCDTFFLLQNDPKQFLKR